MFIVFKTKVRESHLGTEDNLAVVECEDEAECGGPGRVGERTGLSCDATEDALQTRGVTDRRVAGGVAGDP